MSIMITVEEVAKLCIVGNSKAYQIIRGRVNKLYLLERFGIEKGY
ncbi:MULTISPECIES: hypothetical protein [Bacteria]|nr:hypothetical protein [uncultured Cetobacterium sp.]